MSRPRVIDQSKILRAAEVVVMRDGAARLTLDAVALEAGISKASVIYDYGTKQALIKAVIERRIKAEEDKVEQAVQGLGNIADVRIRGRIAATAEAPAGDAQSVALNLCAALAQDAELRCLLQESYSRELAAIAQTSSQPRSALLAFLALEGLRSLEFLSIHSWPEPERSQILQEIGALVAPSSQASAL
nr:TetR family transcriptional regulator [Tianweitania sp.]